VARALASSLEGERRAADLVAQVGGAGHPSVEPGSRVASPPPAETISFLFESRSPGVATSDGDSGVAYEAAPADQAGGAGHPSDEPGGPAAARADGDDSDDNDDAWVASPAGWAADFDEEAEEEEVVGETPGPAALAPALVPVAAAAAPVLPAVVAGEV
jgi:hypothetical protein